MWTFVKFMDIRGLQNEKGFEINEGRERMSMINDNDKAKARECGVVAGESLSISSETSNNWYSNR